MAVSVRIPKITSLETAIQIYYSSPEIGSEDIRMLFGCSSSTVTKLKKKARIQMIKEERETWNASHVNTECAYRAWGLDINTLERNLLKLRKLELGGKPA